MSEPQTPAPAPPPQTRQVKIPIPQVTMKDVEGFAKVWNKGGITMLLDNTSKEFARDFANIVVKSFVLDQMKRAMQVQAAQAAQVGQQTVLSPAPQPAPPEKSIILEG